MKTQYNSIKSSFLKKIFIKLCRLIGYEIIDQGKFYTPTQNKLLNENLSVQGKKSIVLPLGETKITRKVKSLAVIFRSCTSVNMLTQNKKRIFDAAKSEYTFRSLNSIINSINKARHELKKIEFEIIIIDHNSSLENINQMKKQLGSLNLKHSLISLNVNEFKKNINKINSKGDFVTENQMANMANIHKSLIYARDKCDDLIYFVEDDYLHQSNAIKEMILTYERISSQINDELVLCPADYPYLYNKLDQTNIFIGSNFHWRRINETLCTFLTSKVLIKKHWTKFISMCEKEHYPFEEPLHEIYKTECCLSPIPSLSIHCTNINSIFGLSPLVDWKKIWEENKNY